jgi:hypothetical protein
MLRARRYWRRACTTRERGRRTCRTLAHSPRAWHTLSISERGRVAAFRVRVRGGGQVRRAARRSRRRELAAPAACGRRHGSAGAPAGGMRHAARCGCGSAGTAADAEQNAHPKRSPKQQPAAARARCGASTGAQRLALCPLLPRGRAWMQRHAVGESTTRGGLWAAAGTSASFSPSCSGARRSAHPLPHRRRLRWICAPIAGARPMAARRGAVIGCVGRGSTSASAGPAPGQRMLGGSGAANDERDDEPPALPPGQARSRSGPHPPPPFIKRSERTRRAPSCPPTPPSLAAAAMVNITYGIRTSHAAPLHSLTAHPAPQSSRPTA